MRKRTLSVIFIMLMLFNLLSTDASAQTSATVYDTPIYKVVLPTSVNFIVDPYQNIDKKSMIASPEFSIINKSSVPVKVKLSFKITSKDGVLLDIKNSKADISNSGYDHDIWIAAVFSSDIKNIITQERILMTPTGFTVYQFSNGIGTKTVPEEAITGIDNGNVNTVSGSATAVSGSATEAGVTAPSTSGTEPSLPNPDIIVTPPTEPIGAVSGSATAVSGSATEVQYTDTKEMPAEPVSTVSGSATAVSGSATAVSESATADGVSANDASISAPLTSVTEPAQPDTESIVTPSTDTIGAVSGSATEVNISAPSTGSAETVQPNTDSIVTPSTDTIGAVTGSVTEANISAPSTGPEETAQPDTDSIVTPAVEPVSAVSGSATVADDSAPLTDTSETVQPDTDSMAPPTEQVSEVNGSPSEVQNDNTGELPAEPVSTVSGSATEADVPASLTEAEETVQPNTDMIVIPEEQPVNTVSDPAPVNLQPDANVSAPVELSESVATTQDINSEDLELDTEIAEEEGIPITFHDAVRVIGSFGAIDRLDESSPEVLVINNEGNDCSVILDKAKTYQLIDGSIVTGDVADNGNGVTSFRFIGYVNPNTDWSDTGIRITIDYSFEEYSGSDDEQAGNKTIIDKVTEDAVTAVYDFNIEEVKTEFNNDTTLGTTMEEQVIATEEQVIAAEEQMITAEEIKLE